MLDQTSPILYGLVLTGGKSQRMNQDKGSIQYFDKDQVTHSVELLEQRCEKVFISCRDEQKENANTINHEQIIDSVKSAGPTSGILSAMRKHPRAAWLVLACDLPYLREDTIKHLVIERDTNKDATCYLNPEKNWPEPLCTIYEPKSYIQLLKYFEMGKPCPRKVLFNSDIKAIPLQNQDDLNNVNTPEQLIAAKQFIQKRDHKRENGHES